MNTALHLTDYQQPAQGTSFDDRAWRWALRDSGLLADLTPSEVKLLLLIYCLSDRTGRADVPNAWCADRLGLSPRAVRDARKRLIDRSILQDVSPPRASSVRSVVLLYPSARGELLGGTPLPGGKAVSITRESAFPQRGITKEDNTDGGAAPLYERGKYDRAAAELLVESFGLSPRVAHGLVSQYRPSLTEVQNVLANVDAADADPKAKRIRNRAAFVTAAIKRCDYALDERVLVIRRRRKQAEEAALRQSEREKEQAKQQCDEEQDRQTNDRLWLSLNDERRAELRRLAEQRLPEASRRIHERYTTDSRVVKVLIICEAKRQGVTL